MKIRNFTPHKITVFDGDQIVLELPPEGVVPRVAENDVPCAPLGGIPTVRKEYAGVEGLPPQEEGVVYICSAMVAERAARPDVVSPDTGPKAVRDEAGRIVGVRGVVRWA